MPDPSPELNPYAAPRLDHDAAANDPRQGAFALQQPIRFAGSLSLNDYDSAMDLAQIVQFRFTAQSLLALILLGCVCAVVPAFVFGVAVGVFATLCYGLFTFFLIIKPRQEVERLARQQSGPFQATRWEARDDALVCETTDCTELRSWRAFRQFRRSEDLLLLFLKPPMQFVILPRRWFATETDWQNLVSFVETHFPLSRSPAP